MRVLERYEERRLLRVLLRNMDRCKLGVFLCLYTGIRVGELCALKWENISLQERTVTVKETMQRLQTNRGVGGQKTQILITEPKSAAARRVIPIPDFVADRLSFFESSDKAFLLTGSVTDYIEPRTMQNRFKGYLKECRIEDANFHALRHTFATRCIESGFDVKTLSEILGHSSVRITLDKYVHSTIDWKRSNMDKLELRSM